MFMGEVFDDAGNVSARGAVVLGVFVVLGEINDVGMLMVDFHLCNPKR